MHRSLSTTSSWLRIINRNFNWRHERKRIDVSANIETQIERQNKNATDSLLYSLKTGCIIWLDVWMCGWWSPTESWTVIINNLKRSGTHSHSMHHHQSREQLNTYGHGVLQIIISIRIRVSESMNELDEIWMNACVLVRMWNGNIHFDIQVISVCTTKTRIIAIPNATSHNM